MELTEKLNLWVKITGINPSEDKKEYAIYLNNNRLSDYDIKQMNDRIMESLKYDETGMFADAYLKIYLKRFLEDRNISLLELITDNDLDSYVSDVRTLYNSLLESDSEKLIMNEAKKAMNFYSLSSDDLDILSVLELRTSAINCINSKLRTLQFSGGSTGDEFKVSKNIMMYKNLDSLILCASKGKISGVSLAYIRDEKKITDSFFAFVIKNGDNLYLLTDMPKYVNPARKSMDRCPGRDMSRRIESNWFPYDSVANIDISDLWGANRYGTSEKSTELSTALSEDSLCAVIGTFDSLDVNEAFWTVMMLSLIKDKFYKNEVPHLPFSYTRSMITSPLLEKTENTLIIRKIMPSMELKEVNAEDTYNLTYGRKYDEEDVFRYQYLVDRYAGKVDKTLLNLISNTEKSLYIEDKYAKRDYWGKKIGCDYLSLELDNIAETKEDIEYRQKWIARYNFAEQIKNLAHKDYEEKMSELYGIIGEYIAPRTEELVKMHLKNELTGLSIQEEAFGSIKYTNEMVSISKMYEFDKWYSGDDRPGKYRYGFNGHNKADWRCAFTGKPAKVVLTVKPRNAQELAILCGISVEQLPLELQHYDKKRKSYYGNPLLENVDPLIWIIDDEFNKMDFDVTILLSKGKYFDLCKEAGVEADKFWENETPVCYSGKDNECDGSAVRRWDGWHYECHIAKKCEKCKWYKENNNNSKEETV